MIEKPDEDLYHNEIERTEPRSADVMSAEIKTSEPKIIDFKPTQTKTSEPERRESKPLDTKKTQPTRKDFKPSFDWVSARLARKENMLGRKLDHGENCTKVLPQVIMVGVMKCGTEALSTFLAVHPDIALQMKLQTVLFFNVHYEKGLEWYRNQMACSSEGQITMEKSPQYFAADVVPGRIHEMNSSIKLIMIMREPISRAVSHYTHVASIKPGLYPNTFEKTITEPNGEIKANHEIIVKSTYSVHLKRWLGYFKLEQIHIVDGDNYKINPADELKKLEKFLGLRNYITPDIFNYNSAKGFFCLNIPGGAEHCMPAGKGRQHPNVKPDVLDKLQTFFKPFNEELFDLIGQRFDWDY